MSRHDANRLTYDEVTIFGVPALFTDLRVDRSTVPDGVYRYEVRYSDEYGGEPVELARGIMVDFFGTVLMREPIQLPISGGMELNDGDLDFQSGCFSLAEFQQKYPLSEKQVIDFFIADDTALHDFCYCKPISWSEALPGDLVFYPGDSHVGIFVGKDESGNPLIIHCASSQNNVVLTGLQGFTRIGRPDCF